MIYPTKDERNEIRRRYRKVFLLSYLLFALIALLIAVDAKADDLQLRCGVAINAAGDYGYDGTNLGGQCDADLDVGPLTVMGSARHLEVEKYDPDNPGNSGDQQSVGVGAEWRLAKHWRVGAAVGRSELSVRDFSKDSDSESAFVAFEFERQYRLVAGITTSDGDRNRAEGWFVGWRFHPLDRHGLYYDFTYRKNDPPAPNVHILDTTPSLFSLTKYNQLSKTSLDPHSSSQK